jgi:hypothetical protein
MGAKSAVAEMPQTRAPDSIDQLIFRLSSFSRLFMRQTWGDAARVELQFPLLLLARYIIRERIR